VTAGTKNYEKDLTQHVFGFAGRGHGRTSFRLMELIQSGTIPLYIYDDVPWMPPRGQAAGEQVHSRPMTDPLAQRYALWIAPMDHNLDNDIVHINITL